MTLSTRSLIAAAAALCSGLASAATIDGLVNTGAGLGAGATDSHYSFSVIAGDSTGLSGNGHVTNGNDAPFPNWFGNTGSSSWLIPTATQSDVFDTGSTSGTTESHVPCAPARGRKRSDNSVGGAATTPSAVAR